jgi:hypothetical protein
MTHKSCPSKDEIIRFFEEAASKGDGRRFLAHVRSCPECRTVLEAAREIQSQSTGILGGLNGVDLRSPETRIRLRAAARQEIRRLRKSRRSKRRGAFRWIAVPASAAALALLAVFVVAPNIGNRPTSVVERNGSPLEIGLLRPRGTISAAALNFRWTSQPEASSYRLEIYDRTLEPVYQSGPVVEEGYSLPAEVAAGLRKNEIYFWKVVAVFKASQTIESEFARFVLQK